MPRFKIEWTVRNFVVTERGAGVTTCGGECWLEGETALEALNRFRTIPGNQKAQIKFLN